MTGRSRLPRLDRIAGFCVRSVSGPNILADHRTVADGNDKIATARTMIGIEPALPPLFQAEGGGLSASDRQQLRQRADDPIGLDGGFRGQAFSVGVEPDDPTRAAV